ncbi:MAG: flagellar basal body P-ring protein FlgI [Nitrospirales bacterium]|nr:flagellar basal body P-ring protein FlgI [Nitrospira sp.]MDR4461967.1 flagellar basal body P-ring protein FlgI [Nitrospirales bacterium]
MSPRLFPINTTHKTWTAKLWRCRWRMVVVWLIGCLVFSVGFIIATEEIQAARIKDIASVEGVRDNQLIGYGLVVGLDQTGDSVIGGQFTAQAIISMLNTMGINLKINPIQLKTRNTASVMVTAKLPPFARPGMKLDVQVSSMANATSLKGGTLLLTPLKAANQQVYAVVQGPISTSGFEAAGGGTSVVKNQQSGGIIPGGAIVERAVDLDMQSWEKFSLTMHQADFVTALRVSEAINAHLGGGVASALSSGQIEVGVPERFQGKVVQMIAAVEGLDVNVDVRAKVVVNERTGTIVMGEHVRLASMAIAHGSLTIKIKTRFNVSQPEAPGLIGSAAGNTVVTPSVDTEAEEEKNRVIQVDGSVTLGDLVKALNSVGVTPRDLVAVLTAAKAAGALQADLELI